MICFDDFPRKELRSAACKHGFCMDCWSGYISTAISSGPAVLDLRCPLPPCKAEVGGPRGAAAAAPAAAAAVLESGRRVWGVEVRRRKAAV